MEHLLEFLKEYFIFLILLSLFSYLAPKESYRKYFNFFIGALMAVVLLRPVFSFLNGDGEKKMKEEMSQIENALSDIHYEGKGESIFEQFLTGTEVDGTENEETQ